MRQVKFPDCVGGQIGFDGKHQEPDEKANCDAWVYVSRQRQPAHQAQRRDAVGDVIHVKAISRSLTVTDSCQGAVEAVAEPVQDKTENSPKQGLWVAVSYCITHASRALSHESEHR